MSDALDQPSHHADDRDGAKPVEYPTNHVVAVLDSDARFGAALDALIDHGFLESEVQVACGSDAADRLQDSTGRGGVTGLAIRIAEKLGVADEEMENKEQYEQALRDGRFVVRVSTPTEERKELASRLLYENGGTLVRFYGRFAIEDMTPPSFD